MKVWMYTVFTVPQWYDSKASWFQSQLSLGDFDCSARTEQYGSYVNYNIQLDSIETVTRSSSPVDIIPDSYGENFYNAACFDKYDASVAQAGNYSSLSESQQAFLTLRAKQMSNETAGTAQ